MENKGCRAYLGWAEDVPDWIAKTYADEFYDAVLSRGLTAGQAWLEVWNAQAHSKHRHYFLYFGDYAITM